MGECFWVDRFVVGIGGWVVRDRVFVVIVGVEGRWWDGRVCWVCWRKVIGINRGVVIVCVSIIDVVRSFLVYSEYIVVGIESVCEFFFFILDGIDGW